MKMRSVLVHPDGHCEYNDTLNKPVPADDELVIRTMGCGVCGTDVLKINNRMLTKPTVLGHELVGRVVQVGGSVRDWIVGDVMVVAHHVPCGACHYCLHDQPSMCAHFKSTN